MLDEEFSIIYPSIYDYTFSNKKDEIRQAGREVMCNIPLIYNRYNVIQSLIKQIQIVVNRIIRKECLLTIRDLFYVTEDIQEEEILLVAQILIYLVLYYLYQLPRKYYKPTIIEILRLIYKYFDGDLDKFSEYVLLLLFSLILLIMMKKL